MENKIIGIIGGAGVAATNKLNELLEIEFTKNGAFRDAHHPEIIIYQATKAPSRSMYLENRGESFVGDYINIAKKLKKAGANKLCMCCNTAHYAIDEISQSARVPFINLIEEIAKEVMKRKLKKVALIASDGCLKGKVYERYFNKICPKCEIVYPSFDMQKLITMGICNIKNQSRFESEFSPNRPKNIFSQIVRDLRGGGAEAVIIGCTDIRVDYYDSENIDSLEMLKNIIYEETK